MFKVGTKVYSERFGFGSVDGISDGDTIVEVEFKSGAHYFFDDLGYFLTYQVNEVEAVFSRIKVTKRFNTRYNQLKEMYV